MVGAAVGDEDSSVPKVPWIYSSMGKNIFRYLSQLHISLICVTTKNKNQGKLDFCWPLFP